MAIRNSNLSPTFFFGRAAISAGACSFWFFVVDAALPLLFFCQSVDLHPRWFQCSVCFAWPIPKKSWLFSSSFARLSAFRKFLNSSKLDLSRTCNKWTCHIVAAADNVDRSAVCYFLFFVLHWSATRFNDWRCFFLWLSSCMSAKDVIKLGYQS